jgi:hypothetical protein
MTENHMAYADCTSDRDSLHILPLDTVSLKNKSLQEARLIKNSHLEGVVELFSGNETGSGQIAPHELDKAFDFSGDRAGDLELIKSLSTLPSYDVFTLRMELGRMGIGVSQASTLNLSDDACRALTPYMQRYTKPLATAIFWDGLIETVGTHNLMAIVANPDPRKTRENLARLAQAVGISIAEVPAFLEDYTDFLLSATYFQSNANRLEPTMTRLAGEIERLGHDPSLEADRSLARNCALVCGRMEAIYTQTTGFLELFEKMAMRVWMRPSGERFSMLRSFLEKCYVYLGAALCGLSVKLDAWETASRATGSVRKQAEYIARDLNEGLDRIPLMGQLAAAV